MPKGENSIPPVEYRFKKGQSGNPKGKPKGAVDWKKRFLNVLNKQMEVPDITKPRRKNAKGEYIEPQAMIPGKAADRVVAGLMAKSFTGDPRSVELVIAYSGGPKFSGSGGNNNGIAGDEPKGPITQINVNIIDPNGLLNDDE